MSRVLVFAGGEPVSPRRIKRLDKADLIIAADSGAESALAAGLTIDVLVGDLDSITRATLDQVHDDATAIEMHAPDKDATDLELALTSALVRGATTVTVIGGQGGRLDHLLGNVAVVSAPRLASLSICWLLEQETAYPVHDERTIDTYEGAVVSVVAVAGEATGVTLEGLKWPLDMVTLPADSSLGISNVALGSSIVARVVSGTLLVIVNG